MHTALQRVFIEDPISDGVGGAYLVWVVHIRLSAAHILPISTPHYLDLDPFTQHSRHGMC